MMQRTSRTFVKCIRTMPILGVTQRSAWFMLHRIRKTMHDEMN